MGWFSHKGGEPDDPDHLSSVDHALCLAEMALEQGHYPSAVELGRTALDSDRPEIRAGATRLMITANYLLGNHGESRRGAEEALADQSEPGSRLHLLLILGKNHSLLGSPEDARQAFSEGRRSAQAWMGEISPTSGDTQWCESLLAAHTCALAQSWAEQGHYELANEWFAEADRLATLADSPSDRANNDLERAEAFRQAGEYMGAILFAERAHERLVAIDADSASCISDRLDALLIAARSSAAAGRVEEARGFLADVADLAKKLDLPSRSTRRIRLSGLEVAIAAPDFASAEPLEAWLLSELDRAAAPEASQIRWSCARYRIAAGLPDARPLLEAALAFYDSIQHQTFTAQLRSEIANF